MARLSVVVILSALMLSACGGAPIDADQIEKRDELPKGRGLLSGDDGVFEITL